jgi:hypothetical protein
MILEDIENIEFAIGEMKKIFQELEETNKVRVRIDTITTEGSLTQAKITLFFCKAHQISSGH